MPKYGLFLVFTVLINSTKLHINKSYIIIYAFGCCYIFNLCSVQPLSHVRLFATPWITAQQASCPSQTPGVTQTPVHWVSDAIQPSHPWSSPSPPAPNPSQHQGLFQWVNSSHEVAKVLEFQLQPSVLPVNTQDWSPLGWTGWISLQSKGLLRVFSNTTVQKHQFFGAQLSL